MAHYRVEIEAVQIIDVEADNATQAKEKVKDAGLDWETTNPKQYIIGDHDSGLELTANYHYEKCDFDKAKVTNEDE